MIQKRRGFANYTLSFSNNLVYGTSVLLRQPTGVAWQAHDNSFDGCTISTSSSISNSHNAWINCSAQFSGSSGGDIVTTNALSYQSGPLGDFYQPSGSSLINAGSVTANVSGLYHFTTLTNQVKETNSTVDIGLHYVALTNSAPADGDNDGLADYFEDSNGSGNFDGSEVYNWTNAYTLANSLSDLQNYQLTFNVLVNDPAQDYENEQNSQFESTCAVLNGRVIVAYVDSNQGVYGLGNDSRLTSYTPRLAGYSVSEDGGFTFQDKGVPPLARAGTPTNDDGDAGDPIFAVDPASECVYLAATSPRNQGWKGIPVWRSVDGGITFSDPVIVLDSATSSDKPWIAVDNGSGTGQHDVYLSFTQFGDIKLLLTVSTNGALDNTWTAPLTVRTGNVHCVIPVLGPNHIAYVFWWEREGSSPGTNWLKMRQVSNRGTTMSDVYPVCELASTNPSYGNLELLRSNTATNTDWFSAFPFPVPAVNPIKTNHVYVAYADRGTNSGDKADIFFLSSTNGGTNWSTPRQVNTVSTNDQWMPVLAVKPDGTQLFMTWYDRRHDTNNSLIDVYGRFGTIASNGDVTFSTNDFRISTSNFPPVFAGTDPDNATEGHYDPVYPPGGVNLNWWYSEWPTNINTFNTYKSHVGEYNAAFADEQCVYLTWTDYRLPSVGTAYGRNQSDIRLLRIAWPQ